MENTNGFEKREVSVKEGRGKDSATVAKATILDYPRTLSALQEKIQEIVNSEEEGASKVRITLHALLAGAFESFLYNKLQLWKNQTDSDDKTADEKRAELAIQPGEEYSIFELLSVGKRISKAAQIERQKKELFAKQTALVQQMASGEITQEDFLAENAKIQEQIMNLK